MSAAIFARNKYSGPFRSYVSLLIILLPIPENVKRIFHKSLNASLSVQAEKEAFFVLRRGLEFIFSPQFLLDK